MSINTVCDLCLAPIDKKIIARSLRLKYCSKLCNQRAWYIRNTKAKRSIFFNNPIMGIEWENWFIKKYGAVRPSRKHTTPFDFWYEGKRIDLKVANLKGEPPLWMFRRVGKYSDKVDEYICLALKNGSIYKIYRIPSNKYPKGGLKIRPTKPRLEEYLFNFK